MTPEDRALIQSVIDSVRNQFIDAVAKGRNLSKDKVVKIADGRIFSGEQAKELGLVDQRGNFQDAIDAAAKMCGIPGEPRIQYPERKRPSIWEFFIEESVSRFKEALESEQFKIGYVLNPGYLSK